MTGTIERRLLINYRVDLEVLERLVPAPFRPRAVNGAGMAGICLIRLRELRPAGLPRRLGLTTENAAHRVAVEWDERDGVSHGVYIPRRDTDSRLTVILGGRVFPGAHHRAAFRVREASGRYEVAFASRDGTASVAVEGMRVPDLPPDSVFDSLAEASEFFECAPLGYSATRQEGGFEALELACARWCVEALKLEHAHSSFFEDRALFPAGSVHFDSALLMSNIPARWRARTPLLHSSASPNPPGHRIERQQLSVGSPR